MFVVELQQADYLFASETEAEAFASEYREHLLDQCPNASVLIRPVPLGLQHRFRAEFADTPLEAGPGQQRCRRIQRHVHRWWRERDAWWASSPQTAW